jgi:hypothetical protein
MNILTAEIAEIAEREKTPFLCGLGGSIFIDGFY